MLHSKWRSRWKKIVSMPFQTTISLKCGGNCVDSQNNFYMRDWGKTSIWADYVDWFVELCRKINILCQYCDLSNHILMPKYKSRWQYKTNLRRSVKPDVMKIDLSFSFLKMICYGVIHGFRHKSSLSHWFGINTTSVPRSP